MKKVLFSILSAALLISACGKKSNETLQGKYSVNISNAETLLESNEFKIEQIPTAMVSTIFSQIDLTVEFSEQQAKVNVGTGTAMLLKPFLKDKLSFPITMDYKIENDSVLYIKKEGQDDFKESGILKSKDAAYDKLIYKPIIHKQQSNIEIELTKNK